MSKRARLVLAGAVALISAIGIVVLAVQFVTNDDHEARAPLDLPLRAATAPFAGYRETSIEIDGQCRPVAVADTDALRAAGLRDHVNPGKYAGMLFVFGADTGVSFTMSGVTDPLEIAWFAADGTRVDGAHMAPCPDRGQDECPVYGADGKYRVAFEQPGGAQPVDQLTPCG